MRNHNQWLKVILMLGWFILASNVFAQGSPVPLLEGIANNMINGLRSNQATLRTKPQVVYSLAYKYVVPYADIDGMAKRVLPPQVWNNASASQRSRFKKEFTRTLIRTYASALSAYQDETVKFYPVRGASGSTVVVNSEIISSNRQPISVSYRMIRVGGSWRLYDMSVEGVDMLESFRAQFSDILAQGDMEGLIARMSGHNNR